MPCTRRADCCAEVLRGIAAEDNNERRQPAEDRSIQCAFKGYDGMKVAVRLNFRQAWPGHTHARSAGGDTNFEWL
jgi:hypothetical protein